MFALYLASASITHIFFASFCPFIHIWSHLPLSDAPDFPHPIILVILYLYPLFVLCLPLDCLLLIFLFFYSSFPSYFSFFRLSPYSLSLPVFPPCVLYFFSCLPVYYLYFFTLLFPSCSLFSFPPWSLSFTSSLPIYLPPSSLPFCL